MRTARGFSLIESILVIAIIGGIALWTAIAADLATDKTDEFLTIRCDEAYKYVDMAGLSFAGKFYAVCKTGQDS